MNLYEPLQPPGSLPVGAGQALAPGAMLEDFQIAQVIGLTSFGVLYLATHVLDGNTVAVKEYLPSSLAVRNSEGAIELQDPSQAGAFQRGMESFAAEALTLSQYDHPNLLRVTCVWEGNGTIYRAMPYLPGGTLLAKRSSTKEPASQAELQALLDGLLGALSTLNEAGLAHGQIEPLNIFMLNDGQPVLMDFDAVHHAVVSDIRAPYVDAYADPAKTPQMTVDDLHAVAAVLHFAISAHWVAPGSTSRHQPLADVLGELKDSASALGYHPDFLSAIDTALALPAAERPRNHAEFRALFEPGPAPVLTDAAAQVTPQTPAVNRPRPPKRQPPERPPSEYPLNSSESVLALLANFGRPHTEGADGIEPFEAPSVPTLTEEAEPSLPPMRTALFDALDAGVALPQVDVGYRHLPYTPMPRIPVNRWKRVKLMAGMAAIGLTCVGLLGWQLLS
jgi:serine/threonine protein kinase